MYKNLQFKIVVIFVVFTIAVITSVGGIMLHRTVNFYDDEFMSQMRETFGEGSNLVIELREAFDSEDSYESAGGEDVVVEEETEEQIDPRWNELKKILDNN